METTEGLAEKAEVPPKSLQGWQVELWGNGIEQFQVACLCGSGHSMPRMALAPGENRDHGFASLELIYLYLLG